jgi:PhzF family phenazine biosynthesis protein
VETLRYAAFSSDPAGGNPAGVVLDAAGATDAQMLALAAEVGYSETAFLVRRSDDDFDVRYFSPRAEVPFCGHATIASAAALAERHGGSHYTFHTPAGPVSVVAHAGPRGASATLTSVPPTVGLLTDDDLAALLSALRWEAAELSPQLPPRVAYAGAYHPILAVRTRARLSALDYDFDALAALMADRNWTTVDLVWREAATSFHARNPFPPGGVVEDPATGAAAAAFGGYLRALGLIDVPASITIEQGYDLGRPSRIDVDIPADESLGISVSGAAVAIPAATPA